MNRSVVERARPADVSVEQELRARLESLRAMPVRTLQDTYYDTHGRATPRAPALRSSPRARTCGFAR